MYLGELVDAATNQRSGTKVELDTSSLTTHAVIVGQTGSGKTGLGIVAIEEALSEGVPCLLIDPKGDAHLIIKSMTTSREWVTKLAQNFLVGRRLEIPESMRAFLPMLT